MMSVCREKAKVVELFLTSKLSHFCSKNMNAYAKIEDTKVNLWLLTHSLFLHHLALVFSV